MPQRAGSEWPSNLSQGRTGHLKQFLQQPAADSSVCVYNSKYRCERRIDVQEFADVAIYAGGFGSEVVKNDDLDLVNWKKINIPLYLLSVFGCFSIEQMSNRMFRASRPPAFLSILLCG